MEWKPISDAPKDGTEVILWDSLTGFHIGYWATYRPVFDDADHTGWTDGCHPIVGDSGEPTHWMELPDPPKDDLKEGER